MARHRNAGVMDMAEDAFKTPEGAVGAMFVGWLFWGPLREIVLRMLFGGVQSLDGIDIQNIGGTMVNNAFAIGWRAYMPFLETLGAGLMCVGAAGLAWHAAEGTNSSQPIPRYGLILIFAIISVFLGWMTVDAFKMSSDPQVIHDRITGETNTPVEQTSVQSLAQFPEQGMIEWGREGQPIAGRLINLAIWDLTQSPQDKVIKIRRTNYSSGTRPNRNPVIATIYLKAGDRMSLQLRPGMYDVVAASGQEWSGGFQGETTYVSLGAVNAVMTGQAVAIAMGAPDQETTVVNASWF